MRALRAYPKTSLEASSGRKSLSKQAALRRAVNLLSFLLLLSGWFAGATLPAQAESYLLKPSLRNHVTSTVSLSLEMGGELLSQEDGKLQSQPVSVAGKVLYHERLLKWSPEATELARSVRQYEEASATIKVEDVGVQRTLPTNRRALLVEIRDGYVAIDSLSERLTREQLDLVNVVGNSLAIDRLLPGRKIAEGEGWDHDKATVAPLLGMDHVAVCEVRSVVTGESNNQVQIRLAGTVHGTIDGAPTEIELRGAYLFHLDRQRITKFNLAVREKRTASVVVPGLDIVAQVRLTIFPAAKKDQLGADVAAQASDTSRPLRRALLYDGEQLGFRFLHSAAWYITAEQSDVLSLRHLREGDLTAHCNLSTLPPRSAGRETTLEQFERDVRTSIGAHLEKVTASRQWTTSQGNTCLGVVALGKVKEVPVQWRYYLIAAPGLPRVSIALTVEQSLIDKFADADRQLIDSLELFPLVSTSTAARHPGRPAR